MKVLQWLSGKKTVSGALDTQTRQQLKGDQSGKYFQHIDTLPLSRFIDCVVDNNIHALVISGTPSPEDLAIAFGEINQEYADAIGDTERKHYETSYRALIKINLTIFQIEAVIQSLREFPYVPLFDELNRLLGTDFKFNYEDKEEYYKLLDRAFKRSRGLVIQRDLMQVKFDAIKEKLKENGDKQITRSYFIDWLIILGNHVQMTITDQITVYEFCERIRQYNKYVEREKLKK